MAIYPIKEALTRDRQADVHFTLGAVIQGVTVAALGGEVADTMRGQDQEVWPYLTGALSLLVCIAFWYTFMNNYFLGFRSIVLDARGHLQLAALYLLLGLEQFIAIRFLDDPLMWTTMFVLLMGTTLLGSLLMGRVRVVDEHGVRQAMDYDPGSWSFLASFVLALAGVVAWHLRPELDTVLFRAILLGVSGMVLILFIYYYVKVFQRHLDVGH
jgi:hypothetical protein